MAIQRKEHRPFPQASGIVGGAERLIDISVSGGIEYCSNFTLHNRYYVCTMGTHINQITSAA